MQSRLRHSSLGMVIGVPFGGGGQSWESYWARQPEVLFFGLYSDISGGQMPNKKIGSSDYLIVAGAVGSETYECPNTAPYIAADTDYIWFKTDASQRTVTTAELIGYDLQRTPVKYEDASPNEIVAIIILNAVVTGTKRDYLFRDMWLPILWDNNLNGYGHIKDNRIGQQLWTPEAVLPTYYDTFTDTNNTYLKNHTPDSANFSWVDYPYSFKVASNKVIGDSTSAQYNLGYFDTGNANVDMSVTIEIPDASYIAGFLIRYVSSTEMWRVVIRRNTAEKDAAEIRIYKNLTAVSSFEVAHVAGDGILRAVVSGNDFTVYWKGVKVIDSYASDGSWNTSKNHGIAAYISTPYTIAPIDNFNIV